MDYKDFLKRKTHVGAEHGFDPLWMPDMLFDFQKHITTWALRKGRAAIFADCGLGKTFMQLVWAENVCMKTGGSVLILTPLAVAFQTVKEGEKLGVDIVNRREGIVPDDRIVVTNYERLHYFNPADFAGVVCDESSILKNYSGEMRQQITDFMSGHDYRLLCTATAAPNDYMELGTSSEALGVMKRTEMLATFFVHDGGETSKWRLKKHANDEFWKWVCSWARAMRKPSDLGFDDSGFDLPQLKTRTHVVQAKTIQDGLLFDMPVFTLDEQRDELKRTINERCEMAASLVNAHSDPFVCWCHFNNEAALLKKLIPDAIEISGSDKDDVKERAFLDFSNGNIRGIITKPKIAGFGLNWQHCAHQVYFPSHSYEQYYQAIRRCWRYGQKKPVTVDLISTPGYASVLENMQNKLDAAGYMFERLVMHMRSEYKIEKQKTAKQVKEIPTWIM